MEKPMQGIIGIAPGRLDFLGGVADYSGSLVLQMPIRSTTRVAITPLGGEVVRLASATQSSAFEVRLSELEVLRSAPLPTWQRFLHERKAPNWTHYVLGCLWMFARKLNWWPSQGLLFEVDSQVPVSMGVSSSAALEVATLRALELLSGRTFTGTALAKAAQSVENEVVGAPCGLMDQLAVAHGAAGALLPIICRPDILEPSIPLPRGLAIAGWPSGVKHAVSDAPYATARAAAFMGKKVLEAHFGHSLDYLTDLAPSQVNSLSEEVLPQEMLGAEFVERFGATDDPLTHLEFQRLYPLRSGTFFPIEENARCQIAAQLLREGRESDWPQVGELMFQSHAGYSAIGLGSPETDAMVAAVRQLGPQAGFYGARVSGGGSGGTVVVVAREEALGQISNLERMPRTLIH
jgi:galactokinase